MGAEGPASVVEEGGLEDSAYSTKAPESLRRNFEVDAEGPASLARPRHLEHDANAGAVATVLKSEERVRREATTQARCAWVMVIWAVGWRNMTLASCNSVLKFWFRVELKVTAPLCQGDGGWTAIPFRRRGHHHRPVWTTELTAPIAPTERSHPLRRSARRRARRRGLLAFRLGLGHRELYQIDASVPPT